MSSKKRLFIAIGLPVEIKKTLEELQKQLRRFAIDAKWVKPASIHLTLKFLGYVDAERVPEITTLLHSLQYSFYHGRIKLCSLGFFPNPRRPNVLWAGLESPNLSELQEQIENALAGIGFEKENRAFSPHLTLARFREPKGLMPLAQDVEKYKEASFGEFQPEKFSLYESVLHRDGAQYTILESFGL
jgi:RNA 2',3'-cyclic 3'-phosphodiesterase